MNYEDMVFTDNDKARLKENRDAICKWIMDNVVPNIEDEDVLKIDFGGTYRCPRTGTPIEKYHFRVYGEPNHFYFMEDLGRGNIGYAQKFGGYQPFEKAYSPYEIYPIIDNWKMIKMKLINQIEEHKKAKGNIYAFEV